jgi:hypothetical protein
VVPVEPPPPEAAPAEESAELLDDLLGLAEEKPKARPKATAPSTQADMPTRFAAGVEGFWSERLAALTNDTALLQYFFMSREDVVGLTQELIYGAKRLGLGDEIVRATQAGAAFRNVPKSSLIWKQAKPAAQAVNEFVATLGNGGRRSPEGSEVEIDGRKFRLFARPLPVADEPVLSEERTRYDALYFTDWLRGLFKLAQDNVEFEAGIKINVVANEQLGGYLGELKKPVPAEG